jgi:hypothetical protein
VGRRAKGGETWHLWAGSRREGQRVDFYHILLSQKVFPPSVVPSLGQDDRGVGENGGKVTSQFSKREVFVYIWTREERLTAFWNTAVL